MTWTPPAGTRGLVFDCDGTLVDSMPLHYEVWVETLNRHGIRFPEPLFYEWAGVPTDEIVRRLAEEQGRVVDPAAVATERDGLFHSLPESDLRPVPAVIEIARANRGRLPMAVATGSTEPSARASLRAIGVEDWFGTVVSSRGLCPPKPAPDVFLIAAERIGVPAAACVAFEDGEAGLQAARAAGMHVVDVRPWLPR